MHSLFLPLHPHDDGLRVTVQSKQYAISVSKSNKNNFLIAFIWKESFSELFSFITAKQKTGGKTPTLSFTGEYVLPDNKQCIWGQQHVYCYFLDQGAWPLKANQKYKQCLDNYVGLFFILGEWF